MASRLAASFHALRLADQKALLVGAAAAASWLACCYFYRHVGGQRSVAAEREQRLELEKREEVAHATVPPHVVADEQHVATEAARRRGRRPVRVLLIRHAESEANTAPELVGGRSNHVRLTPLGRAQAKALGQRLKHVLANPNVSLHSSSAQRTQETALFAVECDLNVRAGAPHAAVDRRLNGRLRVSDELLELSQA